MSLRIRTFAPRWFEATTPGFRLVVEGDFARLYWRRHCTGARSGDRLVAEFPAIGLDPRDRDRIAQVIYGIAFD